MEKKMMAKLIAVIGIVAMGMSLGCLGGVTTINDIKTNPDYSGKEVVIEGILGHGSFMNAIGTTSGGVFVIREDKDFSQGLVQDIRVKYNGELLPRQGGDTSFYVPGTITKVKVTGTVENERLAGSRWMPYIRATSWEYV
jgi:hypothetical protein